jgi:hypothetical protein
MRPRQEQLEDSHQVVVGLSGYFLAALIYELQWQGASRSVVLAPLVWIRLLRDVAMLPCFIGDGRPFEGLESARQSRRLGLIATSSHLV